MFNGFLNWFFRRAIWFYIFIVVVSLPLVDFSKVDMGLKARVLTYMMPVSFEYMLNLATTGERADFVKIKPYTTFYEHVVEYIPGRADAYALLAFCYERLGAIDQAVALWQKSKDLEPAFFWTSFNLGKIYFNRRDYEKAEEYFTTALKTDLNFTYQWSVHPKSFYGLVLTKSSSKDVDIQQRLVRAYAENLEYLILTRYKAGDYEKMYRYAIWGTKKELPLKEKYFFYAGLAAYKVRQIEKARDHFKSALTLAPADRAVLVAYLNALIKTGDNPEAEKILSGMHEDSLSIAEVQVLWEKFDPSVSAGSLIVTLF